MLANTKDIKAKVTGREAKIVLLLYSTSKIPFKTNKNVGRHPCALFSVLLYADEGCASDLLLSICDNKNTKEPSMGHAAHKRPLGMKAAQPGRVSKCWQLTHRVCAQETHNKML